MNWLITGGAGFIGTNLVKAVLYENLARTITIVDNLSVNTEAHFRSLFSDKENESIHFVVSNIQDYDQAINAAQHKDVVVHLAANTGVQPSIAAPIADMQANVIGTVNYLEACRINHVKKFIFASSGAPIGKALPPIHEELPCHPISPYGASKLSGEAYCSAYQGSFGLNTVALRFSNVYGPYSSKKSSVVAKFIRQALAGEPWVLNGGGGQTRDFIYVNDLVNAIVLAVTSDKAEGIYQVATNEETSVVELADALAKAVKETFGLDVQKTIGASLKGDVKRNYSDISKIKEELGWAPRVSLEDGLRYTCEWFQALEEEVCLL